MDKFRARFMKVCVFKNNRNDNDTTACIILLIMSINVIVIGDNIGVIYLVVIHHALSCKRVFITDETVA